MTSKFTNIGGGNKNQLDPELKNLWADLQDLEKLAKKLKSKKFSARDRFIHRALLEKDQALIELFKKIFPDRFDVKANITMADVLHALRTKEGDKK
ncbi:MAG: hypothetical protein AAB456_04160 [Patescibacteria group bacterium]